jgi:hypothetical protein
LRKNRQQLQQLSKRENYKNRERSMRGNCRNRERSMRGSCKNRGGYWRRRGQLDWLRGRNNNKRRRRRQGE